MTNGTPSSDRSAHKDIPPPPFGFKKAPAQCLGSPFPAFDGPAEDEVYLVVHLLSELHGAPTRGDAVVSVLDSLVRTILSQNTTDKNSRAAFLSLKSSFPTWRGVYEAYGTGQVEEAIKIGGLSEQKAKNIHNILAYLLYSHADKCPAGEPSYDWLRAESTAFIKDELGKHKGVGPKTISCLLMFNLNRDEIPVDTHVHHIAKKLGWVPPSCSAETCYDHLNSRVPDAAKYAAHVLLVEHGKRCPRCARGALQLPQEGPCPLVGLKDKLHALREAAAAGGAGGKERGRRREGISREGAEGANECKEAAEAEEEKAQRQRQSASPSNKRKKLHHML